MDASKNYNKSAHVAFFFLSPNLANLEIATIRLVKIDDLKAKVESKNQRQKHLKASFQSRSSSSRNVW